MDRIDRQILAALQEDGRLSNKELAALVGLAPSSCLERVRRLTASGALRTFRADVDPAALGIGLQAMVAIRTQRHSRDEHAALYDHLVGHEEVVALYDMAGADDFLVHVAVRDVDHLQKLIWESVTSRPEVAHVQTSLIFSHTRSRRLPDYSDAVDE